MNRPRMAISKMVITSPLSLTVKTLPKKQAKSDQPWSLHYNLNAELLFGKRMDLLTGKVKPTVVIALFSYFSRTDLEKKHLVHFT